MIPEYTMSAKDRKMWEELLEWGIYQTARNLKKVMAEQGEIFQQNGVYNETVLSLEIHAFFQAGEAKISRKNLSDIKLVGGLLALQQRLKLEEFELFCVIMVMLSELDYHFEKLFVYLNNDYNQRLLSVEWAVRLFTMKQEVDSSYLPYFLPDGKLAAWVFDIGGWEAGSSLRKGLKLKAPILEFLLRSGMFCDKTYLKWNFAAEENLQIWLQEEVCRRLEAAGHGSGGQQKPRIFHLEGEGEREQLLYAVWYARHIGQALGILDYRSMQEELEFEQFHSAVEEVVLAGGILCIHNTEYTAGSKEMLQPGISGNGIMNITTAGNGKAWYWRMAQKT